MSKSRKLIAAYVAAVAALAVPGTGPAVSSAAPSAVGLLHAPVAGHQTVAGHMRRAAVRQRRAQAERAERELARFPAILHRIAACESHGDPRAVGGGGLYRGAFQFSLSTWRAVGGRGDPVDAPLVEQYRRAQILLERSGPGQWPVCAA